MGMGMPLFMLGPTYIIQTMRTIEFTPSGICARHISIVLDDEDRVQDLRFVGGCDGNHKGLCALIRGMKAEEAIERLSGIRCGFKSSSCPDQVSVALRRNMLQGSANAAR